ncbi:MAG: hypothetical protein JWQ27_831 [Ferruginibacter sp.]|nr:hypothetical protein [Ferruginibacter sp.]
MFNYAPLVSLPNVKEVILQFIVFGMAIGLPLLFVIMYSRIVGLRYEIKQLTAENSLLQTLLAKQN